MSALYALVAVVVLLLVVPVGMGVANLEFLFGVIVPYAAIALFLLGFAYRILKWARSAVPFRITTSCGQQKSLDFIKADNLENPHNLLGVLGRMALEAFDERLVDHGPAVVVLVARDEHGYAVAGEEGQEAVPHLEDQIVRPDKLVLGSVDRPSEFGR